MINLTIVLLTVGLLALVGIIATTVWLGEKAQIYAEEATTARNTRIAAVELRAALQNAESSQRGYLVGGNEIYLAPYDSAKAQAAFPANEFEVFALNVFANRTSNGTPFAACLRKDR